MGPCPLVILEKTFVLMTPPPLMFLGVHTKRLPSLVQGVKIPPPLIMNAVDVQATLGTHHRQAIDGGREGRGGGVQVMSRRSLSNKMPSVLSITQ